VPDTKTYLLNAGRQHAELDDPLTIQRIHEWSGGLPAHLDRVLDQLAFVSLAEILGAESLPAQLDGSSGDNPIDVALDRLATSQDRYTRRSLKLLQVLSVLEAGETFERVRRFYGTEPFYLKNVQELVERSLLDSVPVLHLEKVVGTVAIGSVDRLLQVPKQVRDCVRARLAAEELRDILCRGADLLFGGHWRSGVIGRSEGRRLVDASSGQGAGANGGMVVRELVRGADTPDSPIGLPEAARLAANYCVFLTGADRFNDACLVAKEVLPRIAGVATGDEAEVSLQLGYSLRMLGRHAEATEYLDRFLSKFERLASGDRRAAAQLQLALAHKSLGNTDEAETAASAVLRMADKGSARYLEARALLIACKSKPSIQALTRLCNVARKRGFHETANNIELRLAALLDDDSKTLRRLENVLARERRGDFWNQARAVVRKAAVLRREGRLGSLTTREERLIRRAYSHLHAQKLESFFSQCHEILWELAKRDGDWVRMARLFRYSSLVWRLFGHEHREEPYAVQLATQAEGDAWMPSQEAAYVRGRAAALGVSMRWGRAKG